MAGGGPGGPRSAHAAAAAALGRAVEYVDANSDLTDTTYNQAGRVTRTDLFDSGGDDAYTVNSYGQLSTEETDDAYPVTVTYNPATGDGAGPNRVGLRKRHDGPYELYADYGYENSVGYYNTANTLTAGDRRQVQACRSLPPLTVCEIDPSNSELPSSFRRRRWCASVRCANGDRPPRFLIG